MYKNTGRETVLNVKGRSKNKNTDEISRYIKILIEHNEKLTLKELKNKNSTSFIKIILNSSIWKHLVFLEI